MVAAGDRQHPRGQVDPEDVDAEAVQVAGDAAGAAPDVGDRPAARGEHELGEHGEDGPVHRLARQIVLPELGDVGGEGVVGVPGGGEEGRLGHGSGP